MSQVLVIDEKLRNSPIFIGAKRNLSLCVCVCVPTGETFQHIYNAIFRFTYTVLPLQRTTALTAIATAINEIFKMLNGPRKWSYILYTHNTINATA